MVAVELEVLAKKLDRFGWERDRNSPAHDRMLIDWMDALQDYPLDEIRAACREVLTERPNAMPHEGHILAAIQKRRAKLVQYHRIANREPPPRLDAPTPEEMEHRRKVAEEVLAKFRGTP